MPLARGGPTGVSKCDEGTELRQVVVPCRSSVYRGGIRSDANGFPVVDRFARVVICRVVGGDFSLIFGQTTENVCKIVDCQIVLFCVRVL